MQKEDVLETVLPSSFFIHSLRSRCRKQATGLPKSPSKDLCLADTLQAECQVCGREEAGMGSGRIRVLWPHFTENDRGMERLSVLSKVTQV